MRFAQALKTALCAISLGFIVAGADFEIPVISQTLVPSQAQALIGRPATPISVAGVARRTTRRVVRRSAYWVATLPAYCARANVYGYDVYSCRGTYYQYYNGRYVVVYID